MIEFKVGDRVEIMGKSFTGATKHIGKLATVKAIRCDGILTDIQEEGCLYRPDSLRLIEDEPIGHPSTTAQVVNADTREIGEGSACVQAPIRTFETGATRDTAMDKFDYVKALSPIVLRRYVQYLNKHRLQPDGSMRDFDNWKKGIPQDVYHSSGGRHFMDAWLLTDGFATEDNHGPVDLEDALCAELFNVMGRLHEILKKKVARVE